MILDAEVAAPAVARLARCEKCRHAWPSDTPDRWRCGVIQDDGGVCEGTVRRYVPEAELARLKVIIDRPDPHDFMVAAELEARFQMDKWGTADGFPTAFDSTDDASFAYLVGYLVGKVWATPEDNHSKKLHRITTIAAAAANWHAVVKARVTEHVTTGGPDAE